MSTFSRESDPNPLALEKEYRTRGIQFKEFLTREQTAKAAATHISEQIARNPQSNISFATGETMVSVYSELIHMGINASQVQAFHLDEYLGVNSQIDKESFARFVRSRVVEPLRIQQAFYLDGTANNPHDEAKRYELLLQRYPTDLVILGIGPGGHIAFNEAGTPFNLGVHVQQLSPETVQRDIDRGQPKREYALTQGPQNIIRARQIMVVLYGAQKGQILQDCFTGPISEQFPASILRSSEVAPRVTVFLDEFAGKKMRSI